MSSKESQLVLILDDDAMVTEGLSAALQRDGRTIITCNDQESAELLVERLTPSHIVSDVRLTGQFGFEGLQFIRHARRHSAASRVILMTADATEPLQLEAAERGAVAFLQKPFETRELDAILDLLSCSEHSNTAFSTPVIRMPLLDEVLASPELRPLFQPIIRLDTAEAIGYEALARYRDNTLLRNPEILFQYAERKQRIADLELACVAHAIESGAGLAEKASLFLNIHPAALSGGMRLFDVVVRECERHHVRLDRIVLEITEQGSITDTPAVFNAIAEMRAAGLRFALDDVGVAYSHLPFIDRIQPSFLKISQHFGTRFEDDPTKTKIIGNLVSLARDFGCELILEGIEDRSTAEATAAMGIKYGQGFLFGHPSEA